MYDVIIIGGGPAGLTAGIYCSRAMLGTLILEKGAVGGQILSTAAIENYPGVPSVDGFTLMSNFKNQAEEFGAVIKSGDIVSFSYNENTDEKIIKLSNGDEYSSKTLIIASGARPNSLNIKGESDFTGKGISYCATCDGAFFRDKEVAVFGGGNSAIEEALFLTRFVKKVYLVHRRQEFRATKILVERAKKNEKIDFVLDTVADEFIGNSKLEKIRLKNAVTGKTITLDVEGAFMYVGYIPNSESFKGVVDMNEKGYIIADSETLETNIPGVYAAGDIREKMLRQVATAVGDGAVASFSVEKYIEELKNK
ncbi:MAG: thioredoxin-disulfide reductase [Candidatus Muiribacteriota bacterium]